jgi:hypothetical protein
VKSNSKTAFRYSWTAPGSGSPSSRRFAFTASACGSGDVVSSLLVEDLRPAQLQKVIAARKRCAKIAQLKKAIQTVAQQLPANIEKANAGRVRHRERVRKPHNRAAHKAQPAAPKIDLDSKEAFPSLPD